MDDNNYKLCLAILGMIVGAYGAIIAMYRWVNSHLGDVTHHPDVKDLVYKDVLIEVQKRHDLEMQFLKESLIRVEQATSQLRGELRQEFQGLKQVLSKDWRPKDEQ